MRALPLLKPPYRWQQAHISLKHQRAGADMTDNGSTKMHLLFEDILKGELDGEEAEDDHNFDLLHINEMGEEEDDSTFCVEQSIPTRASDADTTVGSYLYSSPLRAILSWKFMGLESWGIVAFGGF